MSDNIIEIDTFEKFLHPPIPIAVIDIKNGQTIKIERVSTCNGTTCDMPNMKHMRDITEIGMYLIIATGSYHNYFDGQKWCNNDGINYEFQY
jgi:hypothetical protein